MKLIAITPILLASIAAAINPITVTIRVKDAANQPIAGLSLRSNVDPNCGDCAQNAFDTGPDGSVTFEIDPPVGLKAFALRPSSLFLNGHNCSVLGIPRDWSIAIPDNQTSFSVDLVCPGSATATFRLLEGNTPVPEYSILAETYERISHFRISAEPEHKTFAGLPRGKSSEIMFQIQRSIGPADPHGWHGLHQVIFAQTPVLSADVDLGDIQVPAFEPDATLDITITRPAQGIQVHEPSFRRQPGSGFCLVSTDGATVYSCGVISVDGDTDAGSPHRLFSVPHGTYFIIPGTADHPNLSKFLQRVRAGENLNLAGIPKVTLTAGAMSTVSLDRRDVEAAIYSQPN